MRKLLNVLFSVAIIASGYIVFDNRFEIVDWYRLRNYQAPQQIEELADRASLNDYSRDLFYARYPEVLDKQSFNQHCTLNESGLVLGCYNGFGIYILDVTEPKLEDVEVVTAAHEMLHVAYDRLGGGERDRINDLLYQLYENTDNQRIQDIVNQYDTSNQDLLLNELHSILPTELREIGDELEEYYSQYFVDRLAVVELAKSYEKVFSDLQATADRLISQIDQLEDEVENQRNYINNLLAELQAEKASLDARQSSVNQDNYQQYNRDVNAYNSKVRQYNDEVAYINSLIDQYDRLVAEYNQVAVTRNSYIKNIDSKFESIQ